MAEEQVVAPVETPQPAVSQPTPEVKEDLISRELNFLEI
jgi:hypothetical protein